MKKRKILSNKSLETLQLLINHLVCKYHKNFLYGTYRNYARQLPRGSEMYLSFGNKFLKFDKSYYCKINIGIAWQIFDWRCHADAISGAKWIDNYASRPVKLSTTMGNSKQGWLSSRSRMSINNRKLCTRRTKRGILIIDCTLIFTAHVPV